VTILLNNALLFLVQTILGLLTLLFLLRFYFQLTRVSFQNQAAQMVVSLTNFAVKPMRRLMMMLRNLGIKKFDLSTILLAYLTQLLLTILTLWLKDFPLLVAGNSIWSTIMAVALVGVISMSVTIFLYAVLIQAILSWINPHTPIAPILNNLTYSILYFLRRFIPPAGNVDLSPLIFIIAAQLLLVTVLIPLENSLLAIL
jgi:YggT family protein